MTVAAQVGRSGRGWRHSLLETVHDMSLLKKLVGDPNEKLMKRLQPTIDAVNDLEPQYEALSDSELRDLTDQFRARLADGEALDDLLPEAFAAVREASKRTIGLRHYDVQ